MAVEIGGDGGEAKREVLDGDVADQVGERVDDAVTLDEAAFSPCHVEEGDDIHARDRAHPSLEFVESYNFV